MTWQQLKIDVPSEHAEQVSTMLSAHKAQAVTFVDAKDTPMYEPKPGETKLWPDTQVIGLFEENQDLHAIIHAIGKAKIFKHEMVYSIELLQEQDWERAWMDDFHPMKFGKRLWICPSWHDVPEPEAVNIILDPGLAFGTGTHPTTAMCLTGLDEQNLEGKTIIDFGCGSGVLAIAAIKLGARRAIGLDIDEQALEASMENANRNEVLDRLEVYLPEEIPDIKADIVVANILAGPLKELSLQISKLVKKGGILIMSGILLEQAQSVMDCYRDSFQFDPPTEQEEWVKLSAIKH